MVSRFRERLPSHGTVAAYLGLFVALSTGGAYAADKIGSKDIDKNAVKSKHVKNESLKGKDIKNDTLTGDDVEETALNIPQQALPNSLPPSGPAGGDLTGVYPNPAITSNAVTSGKIANGAIFNEDLADNSVSSAKINDGTVNSNELGSIKYVQDTVSVPPGENQGITVPCPAGQQVISGGAHVNDNNLKIRSNTVSPPGWFATATNDSGAPLTLTVRAFCLGA